MTEKHRGRERTRTASIGTMFRLLFAVALLASYADASRLIIYASPGCYTHQRALQALGEETVSRGHDVLVSGNTASERHAMG